MRDRLYLLDPQFEDPALPGRSFYCRDCVTIDGLLARFPDKATMLDVIRIPYPRPRDAVIAVVGPRSRELLSRVSRDDFSNTAFPFATSRLEHGTVTAAAADASRPEPQTPPKKRGFWARLLRPGRAN